MNEVIEINYDEIIDIIREQLAVILNDPQNVSKYEGFRIVLSTEQQFMKVKDRDPKAIYIVLKFGSASVLYGQAVLPVTFMCLTEQNDITISRDLMSTYAQTYNLAWVKNNSIWQVYDTPEIGSNFNVIYEGFRSTISMRASFVVSKNADFYRLYYYKNKYYGGVEQIPLISSSFTLTDNPDSQVFYNRNNYSQSEIISGTITHTMTMFVLHDSIFVNDVLNLIGSCLDVNSLTIQDVDLDVYNETELNKFYRHVGYSGAAIYKCTNTVPAQYEIVTAIKQNITESFIPEIGVCYEQIGDTVTIDGFEIKNGDIYLSTYMGYKRVDWNEMDSSSFVPEVGMCYRHIGSYQNGYVYLKTNSETLAPMFAYVSDWYVPLESSDDGNNNSKFRLIMKFGDNSHARIKEYSIVNCSIQQDMGQIPVMSLTLTE